MKKQLLQFSSALLMLFGASSMQAQCFTSLPEPYPDDLFVPNCNGSADLIVDDGYTSEYSLVQVTMGESYTFSSNYTTDFLTIADAAGATAYAFGTGSVTWIATGDLEVRFYTHADAACGDDDLEDHARFVSCGTIPVCENPIVSLPYSTGFEATDPTECLTVEDLNGSDGFSGWAVYQDDYPSDYGDGSIIYTYDDFLPGDDWFYTPGLNLTGGTTYQVSFKYRGGIGVLGFTENLEVKYGTAAAAASMLPDALLTFNGIDTSFDSPFDDGTATFTPATTGVYYVGFHSTSEANQGFIQIDELKVEEVLAVNSFGKEGFTYFPNPVKDLLHFGYTQNVQRVAVYNVLGQEMLVNNVNAKQGEINMSALAAGTYMVKITSGNEVKAVKVVKQ